MNVRSQETTWKELTSGMSESVGESIMDGLENEKVAAGFAGVAELGRVIKNYSVDAYRAVKSGQVTGNKYMKAEDVIGEKVPFVDDESCRVCKKPWDWTRRQHHCRNCGHGFCSEHLDYEDFVPAYGYVDAYPTCEECHVALRMAAYRQRVNFRNDRVDAHFDKTIVPYLHTLEDTASDKFIRGAYFTLQSAKFVPGLSQAAQAIDFFLTKGGISVTQFIAHSQFSETSALIKQLTGSLTENVPMTDLVGGMYYLSAERLMERGNNPNAEEEEHRGDDDMEPDTWNDLLTLAPHALMFSYLDKESDVQRMVTAMGHQLIFSEPIASHMQPALYLSVCENEKKAILAIRGTYNNDDILTDLMVDGTTWPPHLDFIVQTQTTGDIESDTTKEQQDTAHKSDTCMTHTGVTKSAVWMYQEVHEVLQKLHDKGYRIIITGHSLGAGCGSILAMLLYENGFTNLHCYGYGSPSVVTCDLAEKYEHLITSLVFHDDMIPRLNHQNAVAMVKDILRYGDTWRLTFTHDVVAYKYRAQEVWRPRRRSWCEQRNEMHKKLLEDHKNYDKDAGWFSKIKQFMHGDDPVTNKKPDSSPNVSRNSKLINLSSANSESESGSGIGAGDTSRDRDIVDKDAGSQTADNLIRNPLVKSTPVPDDLNTKSISAAAYSFWGSIQSSFDFGTTTTATHTLKKEAQGENINKEDSKIGECSGRITNVVYREEEADSMCSPSDPQVHTVEVASEGLLSTDSAGEQMADVIDEYEKVNEENLKIKEVERIEMLTSKKIALSTEAGNLPDLNIPGEIYHIFFVRGQYKAKKIDKFHPTLQRLELYENMFSDHLGMSYYDAIRYLSKEHSPSPPEYAVYNSRDDCTLCKTDFTWESTSDSSAQQAFDRFNCW
eukprot:CFRG3943T1